MLLHVVACSLEEKQKNRDQFHNKYLFVPIKIKCFFLINVNWYDAKHKGGQTGLRPLTQRDREACQ